MVFKRLVLISVLLTLYLYSQTEILMPANKLVQLEQARQNHLESLNSAQPDETGEKYSTSEKISTPKAVLFSAVLPGAGEAYAGSWKKAVLFFAAEVTGWAVNISYNNKGDDKDKAMKEYAHQHWSEQKYWSSVYYHADPGDKWFRPVGDPVAVNEATWLTWEEIDQNMDVLREMEGIYSHSLPSTITQQYYEMIGKYSHQFGYGWDDADNFDADYDGYQGLATENNVYYMSVRKEMNDLYSVATNAARLVMINHLISAIDAGITARIKNREIELAVRGDIHLIDYKMVEFVGVNVQF